VINARPTLRRIPWRRIALLLSVALVVAWVSGYVVGLLVRLLF
jgi:hypothetical protein